MQEVDYPLRQVQPATGTPSQAPAMPWSAAYWQARYRQGGHSGAGSSGRLAQFKAEIVNQIVNENGVTSVVEFGCGDGRQLQLARYPGTYIGLDVSPEALRLCLERFPGDTNKRFLTAGEDPGHAELSLSLDVVFHLVEDDIFDRYMRQLFGHALRFVVIYASNHEEITRDAHVRHRNFSNWIVQHVPDWQLVRCVPNPYPFDPRAPNDTSFADFYIFGRKDSGSALVAGAATTAEALGRTPIV
jgi:SAM-dependent methyltransferase